MAPESGDRSDDGYDAIQMSRSHFECFKCGFEAEDRDEFDTQGKALACPDCQSLRVEHVFTADDDAELVTDGGTNQPADEGLPTCEDCGESYLTETTAGPGRSKRSCGCDSVLFEIADDTDNTLANVAIRALNASGDVETAGAIYEGTHDRLVTDGGFHTVTRNGQEFAVVCQQEFAEGADLDIGPKGVIRNYDEVGKHTVIRLLSVGSIREQEIQSRVIGPDDPDWEEEYADLELGESIILDDEEPVADGGVSWYDLHSFQRDILRVIAEIEAEGDTSYGLGIKRGLEERYGEEVNHGRLYPNLDDLVAFGLVEKSELDKRTNRYSLRDEGVAMLRSQKEMWDDLDVPEVVAVADGGDGQ